MSVMKTQFTIINNTSQDLPQKRKMSLKMIILYCSTIPYKLWTTKMYT